jgi:hypothetical protein
LGGFFFVVMALLFVRHCWAGHDALSRRTAVRLRKGPFRGKLPTALTIFAAHGLQPEFLSGLHDRRGFLISAKKQAARLSVTVSTSLPGCYGVFAMWRANFFMQMPRVATIRTAPSD